MTHAPDASTLCLILLATYGVVYTLTASAIFDGPRDLLNRVGFIAKMLKCAFCTGFWVAMITTVAFGYWNVAVVFSVGFAGAGTSLFLDTLQSSLERYLSS